MMRSELTVSTVVRQIAPNIPIKESSLVWFQGGGYYLPQARVIFVKDADATDGPAIGLAVHEAFHVVRDRQGAPFFRLAHPSVSQRCREEQLTNDLAERWINAYVPPCQRSGALQTIGTSRFCYTPLGQVWVTAKLLLVVGLPFVLMGFLVRGAARGARCWRRVG